MTQPERVAIVGIGGLFPGAGADLQAFWKLIESGQSAAREVPKDRWSLSTEAAYDPDKAVPDKVFSKRACFLDSVDFASLKTLDMDTDWLESADPVFSVALKAAQLAINDLASPSLPKDRTGVTIGNIVLPTDHSSVFAEDIFTPAIAQQYGKKSEDPKSTHAFDKYLAGMPAGLIARAFGLGAGTRTLDAACASSLYALKLAADDLLAHRVDAMIAGGVSRPACLYTQMGFSQLRALSETGTCSPFDKKGNGLVVGEGAGIFVLKRLSDALRDEDKIYGVLHGIGLSNDTAGSLLAPDIQGQLRAMRQAYEEAQWQPHEVDMIECHATGTPVGDTVEFKSLRALWGEEGWKSGQCVIGSVKSNVGHLLTGAGAAGLMKVLFAFQNKTLPPTANFQSYSDAIEGNTGPFQVLDAPKNWSSPGDKARRAAVSAFGFGGINAHVLIEEWQESQRESIKVESTPTTQENDAIAVVGMDTHFGPAAGLDAFEELVFGRSQSEAVTLWDDQKLLLKAAEEWLSKNGLDPFLFKGYPIRELSVPFGRFRIPPNELKEMLPQQLLTLLLADRALEDAQLTRDELARAGVFIGIGIDHKTSHFHLRWSMQNHASEWINETATDSEDHWLKTLREACGPALNANRTMGALGGIVASRVAREFGVGGPSFTVSGEESSGLRALEMGVRLLQRGDIDQAIVGAVDWNTDIRSVLTRHSHRAYGPSGQSAPFSSNSQGALPGEGGAVVILKRLEDAQQAGDKIYSVIRGVGVASAGGCEPGSSVPSSYALSRSMAQALQESQRQPSEIQYIACQSSGDPLEDKAEAGALGSFASQRTDTQLCALSAVSESIGHCGAASGLASFVQASLALSRKRLPAMDRGPLIEELAEREFQQFSRLPKCSHWLQNRAQGPRLAAVNNLSVDGNASTVILEEGPAGHEKQAPRDQKVHEGLFAIEGDSQAELMSALDDLLTLSQQSATVLEAAHHWLQKKGLDRRKAFGAALIAADLDELNRLCQEAKESLSEQFHRADANALRKSDVIRRTRRPEQERLFFSANPLGREGKVAFVYPGSGNHFSGMGQDIAAHWPELLERQDDENERLRDQLLPDFFWTGREQRDLHNHHRELILGQVSLGTLVTDWVLQYLEKPEIALGYSLGESAALFGLRAWPARDEMLRRVMSSSLFVNDMAGRCDAVKAAWGLSDEETVDWKIVLINRPEAEVRAALESLERVYLLIVNTREECVVGGSRDAVDALLGQLDCHHLELEGITTVHCEVAEPVKEPYIELHRLPTEVPEGIQFYSGAKGEPYELSKEAAAQSILAQALEGVQFPKLIERAYEDGARVFIEIGPGSSCSRMIRRILADKPHMTRPLSVPGEDARSVLLRLLAQLISERVPVNYSSLYPAPEAQTTKTPKRLEIPLNWPIAENFPKPRPQAQAPVIPAKTKPISVPVKTVVTAPVRNRPVIQSTSVQSAPAVHGSPVLAAHLEPSIVGVERLETFKSRAHDAFLRSSDSLGRELGQQISFQMALFQKLAGQTEAVTLPSVAAPATLERVEETSFEPSGPLSPLDPFRAGGRDYQGPKPFMDYDQCLEFGIGLIGNVLGADFAAIDQYPTRVRLPDEPLMLCHRVMSVEGEALSMTSGRCVTEHDVVEGAWYLDNGRIPTCIAVEAGQADLFLSGYLGIDFQTKGLACYRLLDAVVTFHRELPRPGDVIRYDIAIERFFRQGDTYLFRFNFESTVNGEPLLSMKDGCAGFFTDAELAAGQGVIHSKLDLKPIPGVIPDDWQVLAPMPTSIESYNEAQVEALRRGDLVGCFGSLFEGLALDAPTCLPGSRFDGDLMRLLDRVLSVNPQGGRYGLGQIVAELNIHPDDWFLTCHFVDDQVMPGTLMYECCMHTLRIYLMRMGWVGEEGECVFEPVPGVSSRLKCRGQVLSSTKLVQYQVSLREIGYEPSPFVIADALMFADGKPIVEITNMSIRLTGLRRERLEKLWSHQRQAAPALPVFSQSEALFDDASILAFAIGKPSEAFGDRYLPFDNDRKIARLPGPPYKFLNRITKIENCQPWVLSAGATIEAEYDVPPDEWYFASNHPSGMPFSVLLEIALQPCGWLAAYLGSALTSATDLRFRNLGGKATQHRLVWPDSGTLAIHITMSNFSNSGGMIIQHFDMAVYDSEGCVYKGNTYFGFFSKDALANQVGIREAVPYEPSEADLAQSPAPLPYPADLPLTDSMMSMIDEITCYAPQGGPHGLGFIRGTKAVDPNEWFFAAHFYEDPVCPGSLGLESFLQLLKYFAMERWGARWNNEVRFETMALNEEHEWIYRGQIIPSDDLVTVQAVITEVDDDACLLRADGHLSVDGRIIYEMKKFTLMLRGANE